METDKERKKNKVNRIKVRCGATENEKLKKIFV